MVVQLCVSVRFEYLLLSTMDQKMGKNARKKAMRRGWTVVGDAEVLPQKARRVPQNAVQAPSTTKPQPQKKKAAKKKRTLRAKKEPEKVNINADGTEISAEAMAGFLSR